MNMLNIDFNDYLDDIKDVFKEVFGEYYEDLIDARFSRTLFIYYNDLMAVKGYYDDLCKTKMRELSLKFFDRFNIDASSYRGKKVSEKFPQDLNDIIFHLIGFDPFSSMEFTGIKSFLSTADFTSNKIISERIRLLNYLRGSSDITADNYDEFILSNEYHMLEAKINDYLRYYQELEREYDDYLKEIAFYDHYISESQKRKRKILEEEKTKMLRSIEYKIPSFVLDYARINNKTDNPLETIFFSDELDAEFYIEYFSDEEEEELNSPDTSNVVKNLIREMRLIYFNSLGVECDPTDPDDYDRVLQSEVVRQLIPSQELIKEIKKSRELYQEEARYRFCTESEEFKNLFKEIPFDENSIHAIYTRIKNNTVCVTDASDNIGLLRLLFFSLKPRTLGKVDFMFLHELVHIIETDIVDGIVYSGFDVLCDNTERSDVNPKHRKYERLNETITDILAIEAREKLISRGIYIAEDERVWIRDVYDFNTSSILKAMVKPLLDKYRDVVIHSRVTGDINFMYNVIGKQNFEELNDLVNHVDKLVNEGLKNKLEDGLTDDPLVIEYNEYKERLNNLYKRIDNLDDVLSL